AFVLMCLVASQPAWPQDRHSVPAKPQDKQSATAQPAPDLTATQAQQTLDVLRDDNKRKQLIQTLETIAKVAPGATLAPTAAPMPAPASATPALAPDNLGAQLLAQVSNWFGDVSNQLAAAARTVSDFPTIWHWLVHLSNDPNARDILIDIVWKLALV